MFKNLNRNDVEKLSSTITKHSEIEWNTSNDDEIETHTVFMLLNNSDRDTDLSIEGNKIKIISKDNTINISALNILTGREISLDENGNLIVPEEGIKLKIDGIQEGKKYEFEIKSIETNYDYNSTFDNLIIAINAETPNQIISYIKEITKTVDGEEIVEEGSQENTATFLYEENNGNIKIKGNNELEVYYLITDLNGLNQEELNNANWEVYNDETGITITKNCKIYSKTKYKNGDYSEIKTISIEHIDKLKPQIQITNLGVNTVSNEAYVDLRLYDSERTNEYGKSGLFGYSFTSDEEEPSTFIELNESIDQTLTIDGIPSNGTYYVWLKDIAGNIESKELVIDFIIEREDEIILVLDSPDPEMIGARYSSLQKLINALDEKNITKDSGNVVVQLVDNIANESIKIRNKSISLDLNGYTITSKLLEPAIDIVDGNFELIDEKINIDEYIADEELRNELKAKFDSNSGNGAIISTNFIGIQVGENARFTIGTDESVNSVPMSSPKIQGKLKGVVNLGGRFNFYDGEVISENVTIEGRITDKPTLYDTVNGLTSDETMFCAKLRIIAGVEAAIGRKTYTRLENAILDANIVHGTIYDKVEIDIVKDITKSEVITISDKKNIILDLNGFILTSTVNGSVIKNLGKLEIIDTKLEGSENLGKISKTVSPAIENKEIGELVINSGIVETSNNSSILNEGKLIINGGKIYSTGTTSTPYGILNETTGELIINNGEIVSNNNMTGTANVRNNYYAYGIHNKGNMTINGGNIISSIKNLNDYTYPYGIYNENYSKISNAEIDAYYGIYNIQEATAELNNNTINNATYGIYNAGVMDSSSNTINASLYGIYNIENIINSENENITIQNELASILTYGFLNETSGIAISKGITSTGASYGFSNRGYAEIEDSNISDCTFGIHTTSAGETKVTRGTITKVTYGLYNMGKLDANGTQVTAITYGVYNRNTGNAELDNINTFGKKYGIYNLGNITTQNSTIGSNNNGLYNSGNSNLDNNNININGITAGSMDNPINYYGIYNVSGNIEIKSGNIIVESNFEEYIYKYGVYNEKEGKIVLGQNDENVSTVTPSLSAKTNGIYNLGECYFYDGVIVANKGIYGRINDIPENYNILIENEATQEKLTLESSQNGETLPIAYVGENEENTYNSLKDAIEACGTENTITLIRDITVSGNMTNLINSNQKIKINLNGKKISTYSIANIITNNGELIIEDSTGNASVEGFSNSIIYNIGKAIIKNTKLSSDCYGIYNTTSGELEINSSTISGEENGIYNEGKATIQNYSKIKNTIYNKEQGELNITNSDIEISSVDKSKFYDSETGTYIDVVSYGIKNENGSVTLDTVNIKSTVNESGFNVYGIYNKDGIIDTNNVVIEITVATTSKGYGIYSNSIQESLIKDTNITVKDSDRDSNTYGIYVEGEESKLTIEGGKILVKGIIADTRTRKYSDKSYGLFNEGNVQINNGDIEVSNVYNSSYGIWNVATGKITIDEGIIFANQAEATSASYSTGYSIYNYGKVTAKNDANIKAEGKFTVYGIYNKTTGNVVVEKAEIIANHTRETSTSNAYGIKNEGKITLLDAQVTALIAEKGNAYGIDNVEGRILTLGEDDGTNPSVEKPFIKGMTHGVQNFGEVNFYDGILEGKENTSIYGAVQNVATGYTITQYKHGESEDYEVEVGKEITILEKTYVAHLQSNNQDYYKIEDAILNAVSEDRITLLSNIVTTNSIIIPNNKSITLDLNGYTITNAVEGYIIENSGTFEIIDSNSTENKNQIISNSYNAIKNNQRATLKLNDIIISSTYTQEDRRTIQNEGNLDLNNSKIKLTASSSNTYGIYNEATGKIISNGGEIKAELTGSGDNENNLKIHGIYNRGELEQNNTKVKVLSEKIYVELYGINNEGKLKIVNADIEVNSTMNAILYGIYNNSTEKTTINGGTIAIGDTKNYTRIYGIYNTTISDVEMQNVTLNIESIEIDTTQVNNWTLLHFYGIYNEGKYGIKSSELNVKNVFSNSYGIYNDSQGMLLLEESIVNTEHTGAAKYSSHSIYNKGNIYIKQATINSKDLYKAIGIYNEAIGNITIEGAEIISNSTHTTKEYDSYGIQNSGNIVIIDGTVNSTTNLGKGYGIYNTESGSIELGEKGIEAPNIQTPEISGKNYGIYSLGRINFYDGIIKGEISLYGGIADIEVNYDLIINKVEDIEEAKLGKLTGVAYIGANENILFDSLQEAINNCSESDTVTLVKDIIITTQNFVNIPSNKTITINLNSNNINGYSVNQIITNEGTLTIIDNNTNKGNIKANADKVILNKNNGYLNVEVDIISNRYGIYNEGNGTININSNLESSLCAIYNEGIGIINVENSSITANENGVINKGNGKINLDTVNIAGKNIGINNKGEGEINAVNTQISILDDGPIVEEKQIYGIFNKDGLIKTNGGFIEITSINPGIYAHGIYNANGKTQITNTNINMHFDQNDVKAYGLLNKSSKETKITGGNITLINESTGVRLYGIYTLSNATTTVEGAVINVSTPYYYYMSGRISGSINYGVYNFGKTSIINGSINTINQGLDTYGLYNDILGELIVDGVNVTVRHENPEKRNIATFHGYAIYNTADLTVNNNTKLTVYDQYTPYGIYNYTAGKSTINNIEINTIQTGTATSTNAYGIYNVGNTCLKAGKISTSTNGEGYGIYNNKDLTIGQNDGRYDNISPNISGDTYGIYSGRGTFYFYDGTLNGETYAIYGYVDGVEEGYRINYQNSLKTAQLTPNGEFENSIIVNGQYYESLDIAIRTIAATDSKIGVVEINSDLLRINKEINIPQDVDITIVLQGNKVTFENLSTAITNNGTLKIIEFISPEKTSEDKSSLENIGGILIQNNGALIIGQQERIENNLELKGNPAINGDDAIIYGVLIDGEVVLTENNSSGSTNSIKPFYITRTQNDGNLVLSTDPIINAGEIIWKNENIIVDIDADIIPVLKLYSIPITHYSIEYYYDNILDETKTEKYSIETNMTITKEKIANNISNNLITGYKYDKVENCPLVTDIDEAKNIIKVYYEKDEFKYTIEYYYDGIKDEEKTEENKATYLDEITNNNIIDKNITGYKLEKIEGLPLTITEREQDNLIKVYYEKDEFRYTVEYYFDNIKDEDLTEEGKALYKTQITIEDVINKCKLGYKVDETKTIPLIISENPENNIMKVYYIIDEDNVKELKYTVEYYKEGILQEEDTQTVTKQVQILKPNIINVNREDINTVDKYPGYKFKSSMPEVIPEEVETESTIKIYYIIDDSQTKELSYTIEYYKDGELVEEDTEIVTKTVQVLQPDILEVDKTKINTQDKYIGYKLFKTEPEEIPETIEDGEKIKVYYIKDEFTYTVEYYYDNVRDENLTEEGKAIYQTEITVENIIDKCKLGYKVDEEKTKTLIISEKPENNIMKVYYVIDDENVKELNYTVEYYKDGNLVEEDTEIETKTVQILQPDTLEVNRTKINIVDKYVGYKFDKVEPEEIPETIEDGEKIKVYYIKDEFTYTVEYYYDDICEENLTEEGKALYQTEITVEDIIDKSKLGYKVDEERTKTLIISEKAENNIMKVYYVIDDDNLKELNYTVEYYKDGNLVEEDTQIITKKVQILKPNTIKVNKEAINTKNKYTGYKFKSSVPQEIPEEVETGSVIKIYYIIDESQTKELSYTLEYYKDGELVEEDTKTYTEEVQILHDNTITVKKDEINTKNKYKGYEFNSTLPEEIPDKVESGTVIKIYYTAKMKKLSYKIEYYKEGELIKEDTKTIISFVPELDESNIIKVEKEKIDLNKYNGYKVQKTNPSKIPETIKDGETIKVYYVLDETLTKDLTYTIEYYKESKLVEEDTYKYTQKVQILESDILNIDTNKLIPSNKYIGYKLDKTEPGNLSKGIQTGETIKAYYIIDPLQTKEIGYTVEYYKDGKLVIEDTEKHVKTVQVLAGESLKVDKKAINLIDKYEGYVFEKTNPSKIQDYADNGDVIKVYYIKDQLAETLMKTGQEDHIELIIGMVGFMVLGIISYIKYLKIKE